MIKKTWLRPGFARLELKDSGSEILQRPKCPPGKSCQGGLDINPPRRVNVKVLSYEDGWWKGVKFESLRFPRDGSRIMDISALEFQPLTENRWSDFENLFGERGACGGCWCMWWRLKRSEFERQKGEGNRKAMKALVDSGEVPGLLAYAGDVPVGWCSVAPRDRFPVLNRSRILKKIDDMPVWSIVCFFIDKKFRNRGVSVQLLRAVIEYVKQKGGRILEGYPVEPKEDKMPAAFAWTGLASAFKKVGFVEVARRSETRPIMRFFISKTQCK